MMATENETQVPGTPGAQAPQAGQTPPVTPTPPIEPTVVERMASDAYTHTSEAADALRRGELMRESVVDPLADSDDRLIAMLSYITQILIPVIMPIIVLVSESSKKRPFQRYHAVQSLALEVVYWSTVALALIGTAMMSWVPVLNVLIGILVGFCLLPLAWLARLGLLLYYGTQAYKGRRFVIPGLSSFLRDQGWL